MARASVVFNWYAPDSSFSILSVVPSYLGLRIYFNKAATNDAGLRNPENYYITVETPSDAFDYGCVSVTPEIGATYPTYVDLEMTDNTHGENYTVVIVPLSIQSSLGEQLQSGYNTADFVGVSEMPLVLAAVPLSLTTIRVTFTKIMAMNEDLYDPTKYVWTGELLRTLKVDPETDSSVILTTTEQTPSAIYELTVD